MKTEHKIIGILITVLIAVILLFKKQYNRAETVTELNSILADSLLIKNNELGQEKATARILRAENKKAFLKLASKDKTVKWLQEVVGKYKGRLQTALVLSNETKTRGVYKTKIVKDTIFLSSGETQIKPVYFTEWSNKWETGFIKAGADSIQRHNVISNKYQFTIGEDSNGWFKPRVYNANILNLNPNTKTKELKSFSIKAEPKRLNFGVNMSYGLNTYYDPKNGYSFKKGFHIGAGINYTIFSIK